MWKHNGVSFYRIAVTQEDLIRISSRLGYLLLIQQLVFSSSSSSWICWMTDDLCLTLTWKCIKKINWLDQLEWISLNWRSPHFFFSQSLAIHIFCYFFPNGEKIVYFSKEFFFFLFLNIKKWLIYISHTVLRMTTMELEASLYPLASDNISSIMSNSGSGKSHENVGTRRRKVKTQKHNRTVFQSF